MPKIRVGSTEFDANFPLAFVRFTDADDAAGLLFTGFGIAKDEGLADADVHGQVEQAAVGVDHGSEGLLGNRLLIGTNGGDENPHAEQNALTTAAIAHRRKIGRERAH